MRDFYTTMTTSSRLVKPNTVIVLMDLDFSIGQANVHKIAIEVNMKYEEAYHVSKVIEWLRFLEDSVDKESSGLLSLVLD